MTVQAPFSSVSEADRAYYGEGGQDGGGDSGAGGSGGGWGQLQTGDSLGSGWVLAYQQQTDGDRTRWFAIRQVDGTLQALQSSGQVYEASETDRMADLPHYSTESDAREAFAKWAEENGGQEGEDGTQEDGDGSGSWGEWQRVREVGEWTVWGRTNADTEAVQFIVASTNADGANIYLAPDGQVQQGEAHVFESFDAVRSAFEAYQQRAQNGNVPEEEQPTGNSPSRGQIAGDAEGASGGSSPVDQLADMATSPAGLVAVAGVAGGVWYLKSEGKL